MSAQPKKTEELQELPKAYTASVDAGAFGRVLQFAAEQDVRFYLNGVCLSPGPKPLLVATDGHMMYMEEDEHGVVPEQIIVRLSKRGRALLHPSRDVVIDVDGKVGRLSIRHEGQELYVEPGNCLIDGRYPDYKAVVPAHDKLKLGMIGEFDAAFLKRAVGLGGGIEFYHQDVADPAKASLIFVRSHPSRGRDLGHGIGVIMPRLRAISLADAFPAALKG